MRNWRGLEQNWRFGNAPCQVTVQPEKQGKFCGKDLREITAKKLGDKPPTNLAEVVHHIRRQQHMKSVQAAAQVHNNKTPEKIAVPSNKSQGNLKVQEYSTLQIKDLPRDMYSFVPYELRGDSPTSLYQNRWYSHSSKDETVHASTTSSDLSIEDFAHIQADAKLKAWGWGGSGMNLSLQKQEMYNIIKGMGSTWAWSTILYDLALR